MTPPEQTVPYQGKCHCQSVQFTANLPPLESLSIIDCNCSNCRIRGFNSTRTLGKNMHVTKGEEYLSKPYKYISNNVGLKFCTKCGTSLFFELRDPSNGESYLGINTRVLEGVDVDKHNLTFFDGKSWQADKVPKRDLSVNLTCV